jgi:hypothetical protein
MPVRSSSAWLPRSLSPPEALPNAVSTFQALLAALADRHQLGLDLAAAPDREADGLGGGCVGPWFSLRIWMRASESARYLPRAQDVGSGEAPFFSADQRPGPAGW